eukprot:m.520856 g.520856  ORF g.520856 m.520856 type:complete len:153 (-) comp21955_c1_seq1:153-611(-)
MYCLLHRKVCGNVLVYPSQWMVLVARQADVLGIPVAEHYGIAERLHRVFVGYGLSADPATDTANKHGTNTTLPSTHIMQAQNQRGTEQKRGSALSNCFGVPLAIANLRCSIAKNLSRKVKLFHKHSGKKSNLFHLTVVLPSTFTNMKQFQTV